MPGAYVASGMNEARAEWAEQAIDAFTVHTGQDKAVELNDCVTDLLCDLMHLCAQREGLDFDALLESARGHFEAERDGTAD